MEFRPENIYKLQMHTRLFHLIVDIYSLRRLPKLVNSLTLPKVCGVRDVYAPNQRRFASKTNAVAKQNGNDFRS